MGYKNKYGFTIVELLVVIVVIGILTAITIVSYTGIQNKARQATLSSDLAQASKALEKYKLITSSSESYPTNINDSGAKLSSSISYTYNISSTSKDYCLEGIIDGITQSISNSSQSAISKPCTENGLVGWWKLNGDAMDSSGLGNNGSFFSSPTLTIGQNSLASGAYSFDGVDDRISISDSESLKFGSGSFSLSVWIKAFPQTSNFRYIMIKIGTGGRYSIETLGDYWFWRLDDISSNISQLTIDTPITLNGSWHLLTVVIDKGSGIAFSYTDGLFSKQQSIAGLHDISPAGNLSVGGGSYFQGLIDDARIYNRALSTTEVQQLYSAGAQ